MGCFSGYQHSRVNGDRKKLVKNSTDSIGSLGARLETLQLKVSQGGEWIKE